MTSNRLHWLGDARLNEVGLGVMDHVGPLQLSWQAHPHLCWDAVGLGERIRLWYCNSSPTRFFVPQQSEGRVRWAKHTSMCLDFYWGLARISNCEGDHQGVSFRFSAEFRTKHDGTYCGKVSLLPWSAVCLGVPSHGTAGSNISVVDCKSALNESITMCLKGPGMPLLAPTTSTLPGSPADENSADIKTSQERIVWHQHPTQCWTLGAAERSDEGEADGHKIEIQDCTSADQFRVPVHGFGPIALSGQPQLCLKVSGNESLRAMPCSSSFTGNSRFSLTFNSSTSGCINPELRPDLCLAVNTNGSNGTAPPFLELRHCLAASRNETSFSIFDDALSGNISTRKILEEAKREASALNPTDETKVDMIPTVPVPRERDHRDDHIGGATDLPEDSLESDGTITRFPAAKPKRHSKTSAIVFLSCLGGFIVLFALVFFILYRCSGQLDEFHNEEASTALQSPRGSALQSREGSALQSPRGQPLQGQDGCSRPPFPSTLPAHPKSTDLQPTLVE